MQMHYFLSLFLAALTVSAAPVSISPPKYKRDLASIQAALNTINAALQGLDNSVKSTKAITIGSGIQLLGGVTGVKSAIEDATTQVQASGVLNAKDSRNLKAATDALTNNVKVTINDVVAKKSLVDNLGVTPLVAVALQDQKTASTALAQTIVSKVPIEMRSDAQISANALSNVLNEGISIFNGLGAAAAGAGAQADDDGDDAPTRARGGGGGIFSGLMQIIGGMFN
ncbi:hypothetical protein LX32DRAFT_644320 [Colletotrichum zoysiae]|uniref:Cell wall protein n=1 Tax=Colletotrichum zoysiae TaxID=1216348 RepID=A0AAD9LVK3_9PEZI|nr:hypothetical protein LX32DRAFT_644320 [Colletotrichum zoysiae]